MARTVFKEAVIAPSPWQRASGSVVAAQLVKADPPPTTPEKVGFYVGALAGKRPSDAGARILRALVWADIRSRQYRREILPWYPLAARRFPDDERCNFYVAGLGFHGMLSLLDDEKEEVYARILRADWKVSPYWAKLELPRMDLLRYLVRSIVQSGDAAGMTEDRRTVLENAIEAHALEGDALQLAARTLAANYRANKRKDAQAESIYRYLFVHVPDDYDNNRYLADVFLARQSHDANACVVYTRMIEAAEQREDRPSVDFWSLHLARVHVAQDRIGPDVLPVLLRGLRAAPGERPLEAAAVHSIAQLPTASIDSAMQELLERAFAPDGDVLPHFQARRWDWSQVVRALASLWGGQGRRDAQAATLFSLATELFPDERAFWGYRAGALAATRDYSLSAMDVYERARIHRLHDDDVLEALGIAYHRNGIHESPADIRRVVQVWEQLHELGRLPDEAQGALAEFFLSQERLGDVALAMVSLMATEQPNDGELALRLAREFMARRDALAAARWYQEAIRLKPGDVDVLFEYAGLLRAQDERQAALEILRRAASEPAAARNLPVHFALGETLLEIGRRDDAWRVFRGIVDSIDKKHTPTLLHLARLAPADGGGRGFLDGIAADAPAPAAEPEPRGEGEDLSHIPWGSVSDIWAAPTAAKATTEPVRPTLSVAMLERMLEAGTIDPIDLGRLVDQHTEKRAFAKAERACDKALELRIADAETVAGLRRGIALARRRRAA
ncbi:MAG: tetratricopeptide repeat protein [Armatimonadota bacterium]